MRSDKIQPKRKRKWSFWVSQHSTHVGVVFQLQVWPFGNMNKLWLTKMTAHICRDEVSPTQPVGLEMLSGCVYPRQRPAMSIWNKDQPVRHHMASEWWLESENLIHNVQCHRTLAWIVCLVHSGITDLLWLLNSDLHVFRALILAAGVSRPRLVKVRQNSPSRVWCWLQHWKRITRYLWLARHQSYRSKSSRH